MQTKTLSWSEVSSSIDSDNALQDLSICELLFVFDINLKSWSNFSISVADDLITINYE